MNLENIVNDIGLNNFMFVCFFIGYTWCMIFDILCSFCNYINEKAWRVSDYEKIIYDYVGPSKGIDIEEKEIIINAHNIYKKRLDRRNNYKRIIEKFTNFFKRKK